MDICAGILTGRLTGVSERLTIHEFGGRAAVASSKAFYKAEELSWMPRCAMARIRTRQDEVCAS